MGRSGARRSDGAVGSHLAPAAERVAGNRGRGDPDMTTFQTALRPDSPDTRANREACEAQLALLRARMAEATRGGSPAHTARHIARGKLLVRDRIDRLCDPGTAFLE